MRQNLSQYGNSKISNFAKELDIGVDNIIKFQHFKSINDDYQVLLITYIIRKIV